MRALTLAAAIATLAVVFAAGIALAGSPSAPTVPTVRCPTTFGLPPPHPRAPARIAVRGHPRSVTGLVAYTNTDLYLIAPAGMACSGIVAADGGTQVLAWPTGDRAPHQHSSEAGLSLTLDPACSSCRAVDACPFFRAVARRLQLPCTTSIPAHETVEHVGRQLVLFADPPGVAGDGFPSGGPYPANGLVGITTRYSEVYRATCTLPPTRHAVCTTTLNDVIARYG